MTLGPMGWPEPAVAIPDERPIRVWDVVVTIALLVLLTVLTLFASISGAFFGMVSDGCGAGVACDDARIDAGILTAMAGPLVVLVVTLVIAIVVVVRRRLGFWVPLAGAVAVVAVWFAGVGLAFSAVPS